jgi:hypothetical protein
MCDYDFTPIHKKATISIKYLINDSLKNKTYIAKVKDGKYSYVGGKWQNKTLTSKTSSLGDFAIVADSILPIIRGVNIYPGKIIKQQKTLKCTIEDKESGINSYRATLNNKWILLDYDHKKNLIKYDFDNNIIRGKNLFIVLVEDQVGNQKKYLASFKKSLYRKKLSQAYCLIVHGFFTYIVLYGPLKNGGFPSSTWIVINCIRIMDMLFEES